MGKITIERRKSKSVKMEQKIKWWKLRKEECCKDFRREVRSVLAHVENFLDDWETTATVIRETGRKVLGVGMLWWNSEVQESVKRK